MSRLVAPVLLVGLVAVGGCTLHAQQQMQNALAGQGAISAARSQFSDYAADPVGGMLDPVMAAKRARMLNNERHKSMVADTDKLVRLTTELNNEIAHSNPGALTPGQIRKVAEIEKLAHGIRDKMTMTVTTPTVSFYPPR
jgi:hypothetical protein